jgi:hypothetical protein
MRSAIFLILLLSVFIGCEERRTMNRAQAVSNAAHLQLRDDLKWGEPIEVLAPVEIDANKQAWWQVRYHPGQNGQTRILLVDANSGWARLPPPDYRVRLPPAPKPSATAPVTMREGSSILIIVPFIDAGESALARTTREVERLNILASETGLLPRFGVRKHRDGRHSLIYGWDNERGIEKDERITQWLNLRTPYRNAVWENLAATP